MRGFIEALEGEALHPCYSFLYTVAPNPNPSPSPNPNPTP